MQHTEVGSQHPWEYGSEFHWASINQRPREPILQLRPLLYATGRDAFSALIQHGRQLHDWQRWFVPTYYCQHVLAAIAATGIEVVLYEDSPLEPIPSRLPARFEVGDAVLVVNYFGLRDLRDWDAAALRSVAVIEDHTHDPWSKWARESTANYCVASLRKTLPIPDGAVLWSPADSSLPSQLEVTSMRESASAKKLAALLLKQLYLQGLVTDKSTFRTYQVEGEAELANGAVSGMSPLVRQILPLLPWDSWRERRAENYETLRRALADAQGLEVLAPFGAEATPLAAVLHFQDGKKRDAVRAGLIESSMYPAVHWEIDSRKNWMLRSAEILSEHILTLPCDYRYGTEDLRIVSERVKAVLAGTAHG